MAKGKSKTARVRAVARKAEGLGAVAARSAKGLGTVAASTATGLGSVATRTKGLRAVGTAGLAGAVGLAGGIALDRWNNSYSRTQAFGRRWRGHR